MAQKKERTSFTVSNNLKAALVEKSRYPVMIAGNSYYSGVANDIHLCHEQFDDGTFRTTNFTAGVGSFDFIDPDDPTLSRIWSAREMEVLIGLTDGVQGSIGVFTDPSWEWTVIYNGQSYKGNDSSQPDAMAKAFIKVLNAMP